MDKPWPLRPPPHVWSWFLLSWVGAPSGWALGDLDAGISWLLAKVVAHDDIQEVAYCSFCLLISHEELVGREAFEGANRVASG